MSLLIVSDESGFPEMALKSVCLLYGCEEAMNELRINLIKHGENTSTTQVKWSKMRAKKKYLLSILMILQILSERKKIYQNTGIFVGYGENCLELYKKGFSIIEKRFSKNRIFHPDKNLTLQRHTANHIFTHDKRFIELIPLTVQQEPLIVIADILAGIYRESKTLGALQKNPETITYIPDKYKIIAAQQAFSLGLFSE